MLKVYSGGEKISYTANDSFFLTVESEEGFESGTQLKLNIAETEEGEMIIDKVFGLNGGLFEIILTDEEREKLSLGNYIYKIVILGGNGDVVTRKSGELEVRWGA
ncbi:MAG: hypothetical protein WCX81_03370 [Monoglobales bacterium]